MTIHRTPSSSDVTERFDGVAITTRRSDYLQVLADVFLEHEREVKWRSEYNFEAIGLHGVEAMVSEAHTDHGIELRVVRFGDPADWTWMPDLQRIADSLTSAKSQSAPTETPSPRSRKARKAPPR